METRSRSEKIRKLLVVIAIMSLAASNNGAGYCGNIVLPNKLAIMGKTDYYSICASVASLGTMMFLPVIGGLSRKFGAGRVTLFGVFMQLIMRIVAMRVNSIVFFIVVWLLQGIGNAMYITAPYVLLAEVVSPEERVKYYGFVAAMNAVGTLTCPLIAGVLVDSGHVLLAFLGYVPFVVLPIFALIFLYPHRERNKDSKLDVGGMAMLAVSVGCLVSLLSFGGKFFKFGSAISFLLITCAIAAFILVLKRESKIDNPSVPFFLFKKKKFRIVFICAFLYTSYSLCAAAILPMYTQKILHLSATVSATANMPQTIVQAVVGTFIGAFVGRNFSKRFRPTWMLSLLAFTIALVLLSMTSSAEDISIIYVATALGGVGCAFTQSCLAPYFQLDLEAEEYSAAQGMFTFANMGSSSILMAFVSLLLGLGLGYNSIFGMCALLCMTALVVVFFFAKVPPDMRYSRGAPHAEK